AAQSNGSTAIQGQLLVRWREPAAVRVVVESRPGQEPETQVYHSMENEVGKHMAPEDPEPACLVLEGLQWAEALQTLNRRSGSGASPAPWIPAHEIGTPPPWELLQGLWEHCLLETCEGQALRCASTVSPFREALVQDGIGRSSVWESRLLRQDLEGTRAVLLHGHASDGSRLPWLLTQILANNLLPFLALQPAHRHCSPIAAGECHTCALQADGRLRCFGSDRDGQCQVPADLGPVVAVAAGLEHTCALQADGRLAFFGSDMFDQCQVPADLGPVVAVAAGGCHTCALQADGRLRCLGEDSSGQCQVPADLGPMVAVAAGNNDATHVAIVTEVVDHHELAAEIDPLEAQIIVWQQEAGFIERNLNSASARETVDRIWLCTFNRFPDELRRALHHGPALQQSREALELACMDWQLRDSGAVVIVHAWQYQQVIAALPPQLGHRELVIASSLEYLLELDLATLPSPSGGLKGVWVKARHEVDVVLEVGSDALSGDSEERSEVELAGASGTMAEDWEVRPLSANETLRSPNPTPRSPTWTHGGSEIPAELQPSWTWTCEVRLLAL
ncbi:unnamed protein product, partial [Polarella glacialis]